MPPAVAAVAAVVASIGFSAATAAVIGSIVVYGALSLGSMYLSSLLTPDVDTGGTSQDPADGQQLSRQSNPERRQVYGRAKVGGDLFFFDSTEGKFYIGIMHCTGPIDGFEEYWLGDQLVELDAEGYVTHDKYQHEGVSKVRVVSYLGHEDQAACDVLIGAWPGVWTSSHQLKGIAYSVMVIEEVPSEIFSTMFNNGVPTLRVVLRGSLVLDPRNTNPRHWSDNSVLVMMDYLTSDEGMKFDLDTLDLTSWAAAADVCDEWVTLKNGLSEKRYRAWGRHGKYSEDPKDVLDKMKVTCGADLFETPEGKLAIKVGKFYQPEVTINDEQGHILSYNVNQNTGVLSLFNYLKIQYLSPDHDYQLVDGEAWRNEDNIIARGGEILEESVTFGYVPSHSQARRLAKIATLKANPDWSGSLITNLYGLKLVGESMMDLNLSELDIASSFGVGSLRIFGGTSVEVNFAMLTSEIDDWNPATEEGDPPAIVGDIQDVSLTYPSTFTVTKETRDVGTVTGDILQFTWADEFRASYSFQIRYQQVGSDVWQYASSSSGETTTYSELIETGPDYVCQIRTVTGGGAVSDWSPEVTTL